MLVEDETNNRTGAEMEDQHRIEKRGDAKKTSLPKDGS